MDYKDQTSEQAIKDSAIFQAYQFRSSQTIKVDIGMPAVFFRYELSPIRIQYTMSLQSVTQFVVHICAIVGGVYACSSIFESILRNSISILGFGSVIDEGAHEYGQGLKKKVKVEAPPNQQLS